MDILIRPERDGELTEIMSLVESAFADVEESDHREQELVERLHRSDAFVPALSLVAEDDRGKIVGYILLSEAAIVGYAEEGRQPEWLTLAVAPLAVRPDFWGRGIGGALLRRATATLPPWATVRRCCWDMRAIIRGSATNGPGTTASYSLSTHRPNAAWCASCGRTYWTA